jgi:hypothetical protein
MAGPNVVRRYFRLTWGAEELEFDTEGDLIAFAREQGCETVRYQPCWVTMAN